MPMPATLTTRATVIMLAGELSQTTRPALVSLLMAQLPGDGSDVVLDLTHVRFIDSSGLRLLAACQREVVARGGAMAMAGLQPEPAMILRLLGAEGLFRDYPSVAAATFALTRGHGAAA
jgi:anti-anti-sigma factor